MQNKKQINYKKEDEFIYLFIIFIFISFVSIALSRIQIYDRYRDIIQLGGFVCLLIASQINLKKMIIFLIVIQIYNLGYFCEKVLNRIKIKKNYDNSIIKFLNSKNEILLHQQANRFVDQIILSKARNLIKYD